MTAQLSISLNISSSLSFSFKMYTSECLWQHFCALFWFLNLCLKCWRHYHMQFLKESPCTMALILFCLQKIPWLMLPSITFVSFIAESYRPFILHLSNFLLMSSQLLAAVFAVSSQVQNHNIFLFMWDSCQISIVLVTKGINFFWGRYCNPPLMLATTPHITDSH